MQGRQIIGMEWGEIIGVLAFAISVFSLIISYRRSTHAAQANLIAQNNPRRQIILKYLEEEILSTWRERALIAQFYGIPFPSVEEKRKARDAIEKAREESARRLFMLEALSGQTELTPERVKLERVADSYWDNNEITIGDKARDGLIEQYNLASEKYLGVLREFDVTDGGKKRRR